jgi:hypothetical protein
MPREYSPEELLKLYSTLPQELKEAIFSGENGEKAREICKRNGLGEEKIEQAIKYIVYVLFGLLPPAELGNALEKELGINRETATSIAREVDRFIFHSVRFELEKLYAPKVPPPKPKLTTTPPKEEEEKPKPQPRDIYREPIE